MPKNHLLILGVASMFIAGLMVGCHNPRLEADSEKKYLDLNDIGVTVLIGPNKATIVLDISQDFRDSISLINYSMDEHDLVLKSPGQTRSVYVGAQLGLKKSHLVHLPDRIRLVIDCRKPI